MRFTPPAVLLTAVLCAACSTQPPAPAPSTTASSTTTAASAADVASALSALDQVLAPGCPQGATGPACTDHIQLVVQRVRDLRAVMNRTVSPTFFSPCYSLMDRVDQFAGSSSASGQTAALTYVIQVQSWAHQHPVG